MNDAIHTAERQPAAAKIPPSLKLAVLGAIFFGIAPFTSYVMLVPLALAAIAFVGAFPLSLVELAAAHRTPWPATRAYVAFIVSAFGFGGLLTAVTQASMFMARDVHVWLGTGVLVATTCCVVPLALLTRRRLALAAIGIALVPAALLWKSAPHALIDAAASGRWHITRLILLGGTDVDQRDPSGWTPLIAASDGRIVRLLLEHHANPNLIDNAKQSPMGQAAVRHDLSTLHLLEQYGARVDASVMRSAMQVRDARIVAWAHARHAPMAFDDSLVIAAEYGDAELMREVIAALPSTIPEIDRWNAVMIALQAGNRAIASQLLTPTTCASEVVSAAIARRPTLAGVCSGI